jgi:DNA repair exonuclease SbcCD nuclease subunit
LFKFLHAADLHLDSPLRGLDRYDGAPVDAIRQATRRAVENLVQLAIDERVAFVLIAGDVYDGDWPDYNTGLFFARQMAKLRDAGIAVYLIRGNHDAESVVTKSLSLPDNVFSFPTAKPATRVDDTTGAAIHGQGFAKRAVTVDLSKRYPAPEAGCFNIGLLHTSAAGCEGHEPYAPCTVEGLCGRGYDYWALGHIHLRQTLCQKGSLVAYSGNTQGRHIRETGAKGCLLVTVDGGKPTTEFRPLDVFRWEVLTADASGCSHPDDVLAVVVEQIGSIGDRSDGRPMAARIEVAGCCPAHTALSAEAERWDYEIRSLAAREAGESVWIEKVRFATSAPLELSDALADGPLADLRRLIAEAEQDETMLRELSGELAELGRKLPRGVREFVAPSGLDDPEWLRPLVADAGRLLLGRLTDGDG